MGDRSGEVKWIISPDDNSENGNTIDYEKVNAPKYSVFGERIRHVAPTGLQCSMFCGGRQCKYDNPTKFRKEEMTILGLYSSWVTDKILATSRPSTEAIKQYDVYQQFHENGITSIINLQHPGEHAACGFGLEASGFSYKPQDFMDNNIFFYNFGWNDYGVRSLQSILDMVKVMDFAVTTGKAAVHCHAGLGRTGVLIACYIIYSERLSSNEAIHKVRKSRPKAIQTRGQINCVKDFASYINPMWVVFAEGEDNSFTLDHFMSRQRHLLHGEEGRTLKYIPKIIFTICQRLLNIAEIDFNLAKCTTITHFSFMKNTMYNSKENEECSINLKNNEGHAKLKTIQKIHSSENIANSGPKVCDELELSSSKVTLTTAAHYNSMPDVHVMDEHSSSMKQKTGVIFLKPLRSKNKIKKKRRIAELKELEQDNIDNDNNMTDKSDMIDSTEMKNTSSKALDLVSLASYNSQDNSTSPDFILKCLAYRCGSIKVLNDAERYKNKLNNDENTWQSLLQETCIPVLTTLFWSWLSHLEGPIISTETIELMALNMVTPENVFQDFDRTIWKLLECVLTTLKLLDGKQTFIDRILRRFTIIMTGDDNLTSSDGSNDDQCGVIFLQFITAWLDILKSN